MMTTKRHLIDELTSPLQRIMWIYNVDEPARRSFENNICAFHIGGGYFLTIAHNLRSQAGVFKSISAELYQKELLYKLDGSQKLFLDQHYFTDEYTQKLYLNNIDATSQQNLTHILRQKRFDTRWVTLAAKKITVPHVVIQFRENSFYGNAELLSQLQPHQYFYEEPVKKHTFLLEAELVEAFYNADIALYRIINTPSQIIDKIPYIDINTDLIEDEPNSFHCLQSSPNSEAGRLLNDARIEGLMDHLGLFTDDMGGNYPLEGYRYLVRGYFRFGSSGAPYIVYDPLRGRYVANAIQSEACGLQLTINNGMEGNYQYVNAIASPLFLVKEKLRELQLSDGLGFEHVF